MFERRSPVDLLGAYLLSRGSAKQKALKEFECVLYITASPFPPPPPVPKQAEPPHPSPTTASQCPSLLPSRFIAAAMSSASALSHLINRNLCYNDLSTSPLTPCIFNEGWRSSCLPRPFLSSLFFNSTSEPLYVHVRARRPGASRRKAQAKHQSSAAVRPLLPLPLIICSLHQQHDFSRLLIPMQVIYLIK